MFNFIFNVLLWTFALYGIMEVFKSIIHTYYHPKINSSGIYIFIGVKNQENKIEGFIRSILFRIIYGKEENIDNIFVVDLNSNDKTSDILHMLSKDYNCIQCIDLNNFKEILELISEREQI